MSTEKTKQRLGNQNSKESVNTDTYLTINLEGKERLLPNNQINHIIDVAEQFNKERQSSSLYKILGSINSTVSNCLFNLTDSFNEDSFTYAVFNKLSFLSRSYPQDFDLNDEEDLTYANSIDYYLKEKEGWFGYYDPDISKKTLCNFFDMEPKRQRFSLLPDYAPYKNINNVKSVKNWELTITYPSSSNSDHYMVNNGLLIVDVKPVSISTREMNTFGVVCKHNLSSGDIVELNNINGLPNGQYTVYSVGLENGDLKDYYFVIDTPNDLNISQNSRMNKIVNDNRVNYYFRIFSKIKTKSSQIIESDDYETYQAGFSENFYNDPIIQFVFNEEIDVSNLKDNLGRPLSEIYLTILKTTSNNLFTEVKSGIEAPYIQNLNNSDVLTYLLGVPVIQKIHNGNDAPFISHTPLETFQTVGLPNNFYGDIVEYNQDTLLETILSDVQHRFNTYNRQLTNTIQQYITTTTDLGQPPQQITLDLGPRQEGYYYKAHHLIKIRDFSNYIEIANNLIDEVPSYATLKEDGTYVWRDLLSIGFNDGDVKTLDYPFLNGSHYRYENYCFNLKRQDPYAQWGLLYTNFPSDALGDRITDRFTVKSSDDVC
jgi:hypothetical protein